MKNDEYNYNNKPCARCHSVVNRFDAERLHVNTRGNVTELFFHYDCYTKYEEGRAMVARGVTGVEVDADGEYISMEKNFANDKKSNLRNDMMLASLLIKIKGKSESEIINLLNSVRTK